MPRTRPATPPETAERGYPWSPVFAYNNLPPVPGQQTLATLKVRARCELARTALKTLRETAAKLSDREALLRTLPMVEAQASSDIENIVTTVPEMIRYLGRPKAPDLDTAEALRHHESIIDAYERRGGEPTGTALATRACSRTKGHRMPIRRERGTVIAGPRGIVYTPPTGEARIRGMLDQLWSFMHDENGVDPLIRMAAGHHQFESIHPFADGNGRTGRLINAVYLAEQKLTDLPILCHSRYILRHRQEYYRLLQHTRKTNDWEPWIVWMLDGVRDTAEWIVDTLHRQAAMAQDTIERYAEEQRRSPVRSEILQFVCTRPYCFSTDLVGAGLPAKPASALAALRRLDNATILEEQPGHTPALFVNHRTLALWTEQDD